MDQSPSASSEPPALRQLTTALLLWACLAGPAQGEPWVERSDTFTRKVLAVGLRHSPEMGSRQGLAEYDERVSQPTRADELQKRAEREEVLKQLQEALRTEQQPQVRQDLQILIGRLQRSFRAQDWGWKHTVPFLNASEQVFSGIHTVLDDQAAADRHPAALVRLRKYAGDEPGTRALTEILKEETQRQMAVPGAVFPARQELETELSRNQGYLTGLDELLHKQGLVSPSLPHLVDQLKDYDAWVRATVLPRARADFRLPAEQYALNLEEYGIELSPDALAVEGRAAFHELQAEMNRLAARIAQRRGLPSSDYRAVMAELKKEQLAESAILPLYQQRLGDIEALVRRHDLLTLPNRPALIRLASDAETASEPAPHMQIPPFLHNTGQRGAFVLPLLVPGQGRFDDFTFDAAAWTLTAHEARPGHELQYDSMLERGVSLARVLYADNATNVEGWGLYSEWLMFPYMPEEGQLVSLDYRLLRAARAFLDPELQAGKITPEEAYRVLTQDVVCSHAMASQELECYTYRFPGQACSYFYGYTQMRELRSDTEQQLGRRFRPRLFHDFILAQGLLPPKLLRKAVADEFIPSQLANP